MRKLLIVLAVLAAAPVVGWQMLEHGIIWFNAPSRSTYPIRGLDVSHHQGPIDWAAVAGEKIDFVYVKATEGGDWRDKRFTENFEGAGKAGLRRGAYHFFTLCRPGAEQAKNFVEVVPPTDDALPVAIDLEFGGNCSKRPDASTLDRDLADFIRIVEAEYGARPILYVTEEFLEVYPVHTLGYDLWIRSIYTEPIRPWAMWQYHCRARVDGIDGPVDLNVGSKSWWSGV